jgi:hypothetical protein
VIGPIDGGKSWTERPGLGYTASLFGLATDGGQRMVIVGGVHSIGYSTG